MFTNSDIIEEIEASVGKDPIVYLKFSKNRHFAENIIQGELFANTPEYFRQLEIKSGEHGQGDIHELLQIMQMTNIQFYDYVTKKLEFNFTNAKVTFQYKQDGTVPMVSFVGIPIRQMKIISHNETEVIFGFPFSDEEYKTIEEKFGSYCVIIEPKVLVEKIFMYCKELQLPYEFKKVNYCALNQKGRILSFAEPSVERFFYKDEDLSYQREFRLIIGTEMPSDHFIRIGSFGEKAKIIESKNLKDLCLCYSF